MKPVRKAIAVQEIPGWKLLDRIEYPVIPELQDDSRRFHFAAKAGRVFKMVLVMAWFQCGYRQAGRAFNWQNCPLGTLNRALRRMVPNPRDINAPLRLARSGVTVGFY